MLIRRTRKARKSSTRKKQRKDKKIEKTKNSEVRLQGIMLGKQTAYREQTALVVIILAQQNTGNRRAGSKRQSA